VPVSIGFGKPMLDARSARESDASPTLEGRGLGGAHRSRDRGESPSSTPTLLPIHKERRDDQMETRKVKNRYPAPPSAMQQVEAVLERVSVKALIIVAMVVVCILAVYLNHAANERQRCAPYTVELGGEGIILGGEHRVDPCP